MLYFQRGEIAFGTIAGCQRKDKSTGIAREEIWFYKVKQAVSQGNFFEGGDNFVANLLAALIAYSLTLKKVAMNMEIIDEAGLIARIIPNSSSRFYFPTFCQLDHFQVREVSGFDAESNEGSYLVKAIDGCRSRIDV